MQVRHTGLEAKPIFSTTSREVSPKRRAVPFGSVPGAKNLALSPRRRSVFPRKFLPRCSGRIPPWLREVLGELAKRRAVPFRERPSRQELAHSPLQKSVLP